MSLRSLNKSEFICIGKILKAHHLNGELFLFLFSADPSWNQPDQTFYLTTSTETPPQDSQPLYTIKKLRAHKDGFILSIKGVDNRTQAEQLEKQFFWIPTSKLISKKGETPYLNELLDFAVFNEGQPIGKVVKFSSNGAQDILVVRAELHEHTYDILLVDAFLERIDYDQQTIYLKLPEGLLEINLPEKKK